MSMPAAITGKEFFEMLRDDLAAIEREFGRDTVSGVGAITEIGEYLRGGGGKRIRPAPMGRAFRYQKRTAHLWIVVREHHVAAAERHAANGQGREKIGHKFMMAGARK